MQTISQKLPPRKPRASKRRSATPDRKDAYAKVTDRIVELLDAGVVAWRLPFDDTPRVGGAMTPFNPTTGTVYRGINWLMLSMTALSQDWTGAWMTAAQAKKAGGHVRKGERGTPVMFWRPSRRTLTEAEASTLRAEGKPVRVDDDGRPYIETIASRGFTVFNVAQVEGVELAADALEPPASPWATDASTDAVIDSYLLRSSTKLRIDGESAHYQPATHTVTMPDKWRFTREDDWYAVTFHELGHSTGAAHLLNRDLSGVFGSAPYAHEELTAELTAAMVCSVLGVTSPERLDAPAAYIANWRQRLSDDPRLIATAAQRAHKAADLILGTGA